ncbi:hypothetical protein JEV20_12485 [Pseudomonas aeruginosa]|nr:hypothetical protein [Pseudomonas aeruginosa]
MKYRFVNEHRHQHAITKMCQVLRIARAGFYQWLHKPVSDRERENNRLLKDLYDQRCCNDPLNPPADKTVIDGTAG